MKEKVVVEVPGGDLQGLSKCETLDDLVNWATKIRDAVPEEFRAVATVDCEQDWDTGWGLTVTYSRPKTIDDVAAELARQMAHKSRAEQRERELYESLKAKFGG